MLSAEVVGAACRLVAVAIGGAVVVVAAIWSTHSTSRSASTPLVVGTAAASSRTSSAGRHVDWPSVPQRGARPHRRRQERLEHPVRTDGPEETSEHQRLFNATNVVTEVTPPGGRECHLAGSTWSPERDSNP